MTTIRIALAVALLVAMSHTASAQHRSGCAVQSDCTARPTCCPSCSARCIFEAKPITVEKSCYEVDCEPICVPKVRFPWQKCCEPMCAEIKWVNVLKTRTYECEDCEYSWKVEWDGNGCSCEDHAAPAPKADQARAQVRPVPQRTIPAMPQVRPVQFRVIDEGQSTRHSSKSGLPVTPVRIERPVRVNQNR